MKCVVTLVVVCLALHQVAAVTTCYECTGTCDTETEKTCPVPASSQCYTTIKGDVTTKGCTPGVADATFCTAATAVDNTITCEQCNEELCNSAGIQQISAILVSLTAFALLKVIY